MIGRNKGNNFCEYFKAGGDLVNHGDALDRAMSRQQQAPDVPLNGFQKDLSLKPTYVFNSIDDEKRRHILFLTTIFPDSA